jgi:uncharacterized protein YbjT (DUF2867 family)
VTPSRDVLVTGATGYMGSRLIPALVERGHRVRALTREVSRGRVAAGAEPILGNALDAESIASALRPEDTIVHLVGTPHPSPAKAKAFVAVDLMSVRAAVQAARDVGVSHFVYVSVAQPAPVMRAFLEVRAEGERLIRESALPASILRPWYVLGPGHRWPYVLVPFYAMLRVVPRFRDGAERLGLVTVRQMIAALVNAVETSPSDGQVRILNVPDIRASVSQDHR